MDITEQTVLINPHAMLPVGTLLQNGKYRIERHLSSGGFGNTYVATNTEFEEQVAIKEFFMRGVSERNGDSLGVSVSNQDNIEQFISQREKFKKEARRLRRLKNEHIVGVHDLFEENGTVYYEMDLIKGESLSERMKCMDHPLNEEEVLTILDQVLDALSVVHAQGLYHLDLKPANIMIDDNGRALLIDFGASKQMSVGDSISISTSSALAYTPGFAPLEQTEQNIKNFGPWTDLYALGATLYKLLTGITPPSASEMLMSTTPLSFPSPVREKTQQLIAWMMKPRMDERPQSVIDVKRFLDEVSPKRVLEHSPYKSKLWWGFVVGVAAAITAAIIVSTYFMKESITDTAIIDSFEQTTVTNKNFTSPVKDGMGTYQYTGNVDEKGRPNGIGKAVFSNGDYYRGPFVHGVMEGIDARYSFKTGDCFEGVMRNDQFFKGTYTTADGSYFTGSFNRGQPEHGIWYNKNGKKMSDL